MVEQVPQTPFKISSTPITKYIPGHPLWKRLFNNSYIVVPHATTVDVADLKQWKVPATVINKRWLSHK